MNHLDVRAKSNSRLSVLKTSSILVFGTIEELFPRSLSCRLIYLRPFLIRSVNAQRVIEATGPSPCPGSSSTGPGPEVQKACFTRLIDSCT